MSKPCRLVVVAAVAKEQEWNFSGDCLGVDHLLAVLAGDSGAMITQYMSTVHRRTVLEDGNALHVHAVNSSAISRPPRGQLIST